VPYADSRLQLDAARQSFRELNRRLRKASFDTNVAYADE